jgi:hypothetical protein
MNPSSDAGTERSSPSPQEQLRKAETLLWEIRNGKHSLPGTLVQIDRYFSETGDPAMPRPEGTQNR